MFAVKRILVYKGWKPDSEPVQIVFRPVASFEETANSIIKILQLEGVTPSQLKISSSDPDIPELDKTKCLKEQGLSSTSKLTVNFENPDFQPTVSEGEDSNLPQKIVEEVSEVNQYTPIVQVIEADSKGLASQNYDITHKFMIVYGLAATLYDINKKENLQINISPSYIFVDKNFRVFVDREKLKADSKSQNPKDFLFINAKYKQFLPEEVIEKGAPSEDPEQRMKGDVYSFGTICYAIFSASTSFNIKEIKGKQFTDVPASILSIAKACWENEPNKRPGFSDILQIICEQDFVEGIGNIDIDQFKEYQKGVVGEEFIKDLSIFFNFDLSKIPKVQIRQRDDFEIGNLIGKGGFGQVLLATDKTNGKQIAYKELFFNPSDSKTLLRTYREVEILANSNNYAVQNLYGVILGKDDNENEPTVIMTPFLENGGLDKVIATKPPGYDFTQKYIMMYGIAAGMFYLHKRNIIHRDIKAENILVNENLEPIITDFGLSKQVQDSNNLYQSMVGTGSILYMAPELLDNDVEGNFSLYDARMSDVYAFGMLVYYIFAGKRPYSECKNPNAIMTKIVKGTLPKEPNNFPRVLDLLIKACCSRDPISRPTFEEIVKIISHPDFISHSGAPVDMERFEAYQKKVNINSLLNKDEGKVDNNAFSVPKEFIRSREEFNVISEPSTDPQSFFITADVKDTKNEGQFKCIELKKEFFDDQDFYKNFESMVQVMFKVNHPAILRPHAIINDEAQVVFKEDAESIFDIFPKVLNAPPVIFLPTPANGNLPEYIGKSHRQIAITQKFIILYGIVAGMYYMHRNGMAHLNLNPGNILLDENAQPLIKIDITSKPKAANENLFYLLQAFSFPYVAPELLDFTDNKTSIKIDEEYSDVYSFAMIVYYLFTNEDPWREFHGYKEILDKTLKNERPEIDDRIPYPFNKLIQDCWHTKPILRPTFEVLLKRIGSSDFIRSIDFLELDKFQSYQKTVVSEDFIFPIQLYETRRREEFQVQGLAGTGSFGNVRIAIDKKNQNQVAFKQIPKENDKNGVLVDREVQILSSINFPSIVSLYGIINPEPGDKDQSYVVLFPYAPNKDLEKLITKENRNNKPKEWTYTQKCIVMYGIAFGMYKLHLKGIIHRDLKPQNILISSEFEPWITDFELSKFVDPNQTMFQTMSYGTPAYMAPEAFDYEADNSSHNLKYNGKAADVYSFGVLSYFLMTGIAPWGNVKNQFTLMNKISKGDRPQFPDHINEPIKNLISDCWVGDPSQRPTFKDIIDRISEPGFFKNPKHSFDGGQFYRYQVKLGELDYIKYTTEEIMEFQKELESQSLSISASPSTDSAFITDRRNMAEKGKPEDQYAFACILRDGELTAKDLEGAASYFKKASDQNYPEASIAYALCLKDGIGTKKNKQEAIQLMTRLANDEDNMDAQVILASWYSKDRPRKYGLAYELLKRADAKGQADAPAMIGALMEKKKFSVMPSKEEILNLYKKSCDKASPYGMYHMATVYHYGQSDVPKNTTEAIRLYNLAAATQNPNRGAAVFSLSVLHEEMGNFNDAFNTADFFRQQDMFEGFVRCADLYKRGVGVQKNEEKANEYIKIASDPKYAREQMLLGLLYSRAKGLNKSVDLSFYWTQISANNGFPQAQANLAGYYMEGHGCQADLDKAEEWALKSANKGNDHSMGALAKIYKKKNMPEKELQWLEKAAEAGNERSLVDLGKKYKELNRNDDALRVFKESAENRTPLGMFLYGKELLAGNSQQQNEEAMAMIKAAADIGCREAVKKLISIYEKGDNFVQKDHQKASEYKALLKKLPSHSKKEK